MSGLGWGVPRPHGASKQRGQDRRAIQRLSGTDVAILGSGLGAVWTKITKSYTDFAVAATTNNINVYSLPAKTVLHKAVIKHSVVFTGGALVTYVLTVFAPTGGTGAQVDAFTAVSATNFGSDDESSARLGLPYDFGSATNLAVQANSGAVNLDQATQGSVDVWILTSLLP